MVPLQAQGKQFPFEGRGIPDSQRHLIIGTFVTLQNGKVNFNIPGFPDVHGEAAADQFQVHDIFKDKSAVYDLVAQQILAQAQIHQVIFTSGFQILPALNVISGTPELLKVYF
jgi:hypothetical protein